MVDINISSEIRICCSVCNKTLDAYFNEARNEIDVDSCDNCLEERYFDGVEYGENSST